ncbi:MAG: hypothetical protein D6754_10605 [Alphaproteobacteria bacterium]|nr:MAG: hypothetical protein D6754_10605 [Alphaproteobacteria bacterium]
MPDRGIAILGYGSLIWDLDSLAPHVEGAWRMAAGPALPMEFSRISKKRRMGLVVCLDPEHGAPCPTHAIRSARQDIAEAAQDLARREHAPLSRIGSVCMKTGRRNGRLPEITARISQWCRQAGWAGAVWADLDPNFHTVTGADFTLPRALAYLQQLDGASLEEAVRYIALAPAATDTPLRRALAGTSWWRAACAARGLPVGGR